MIVSELGNHVIDGHRNCQQKWCVRNHSIRENIGNCDSSFNTILDRIKKPFSRLHCSAESYQNETLFCVSLRGGDGSVLVGFVPTSDRELVTEVHSAVRRLAGASIGSSVVDTALSTDIIRKTCRFRLVSRHWNGNNRKDAINRRKKKGVSDLAPWIGDPLSAFRCPGCVPQRYSNLVQFIHIGAKTWSGETICLTQAGKARIPSRSWIVKSICEFW